MRTPERIGLRLGWAQVGVLCGALLVAPAAVANDAVFGGQGVNLVPLEETRVRMLSEDILIEQVVNEDYETGAFGSDVPLRWRVQAVYHFENPSGEPVQLQMGFPERRCVDGCWDRQGAFFGLVTTVRGRAVPQRVGQVSLDVSWSNNLGRVYVYDVGFAPHETVEIVHRYSFDKSGLRGGEYLRYVTQTGRLWAGPIGRARFTIRPLVRPWLLRAPPEYHVRSYTHVPVSPRGGSTRRTRTEIVFEMEDWTPQEDLLLELIDEDLCGMRLFDLDCMLPEVAHEAFRRRPLCEAWVLARHGKPFEDPRLRRRFYDQPEELSAEASGCLVAWQSPRQLIWLAPNPDYSDTMLSDGDHRSLVFFRGEYSRIEALDLGGSPPGSEADAKSQPATSGEVPAVPPAASCGHCAAGARGSDSSCGPLALLPLLLVAHRRRRRRAPPVDHRVGSPRLE